MHPHCREVPGSRTIQCDDTNTNDDDNNDIKRQHHRSSSSLFNRLGGLVQHSPSDPPAFEQIPTSSIQEERLNHTARRNETDTGSHRLLAVGRHHHRMDQLLFVRDYDVSGLVNLILRIFPKRHFDILVRLCISVVM